MASAKPALLDILIEHDRPTVVINGVDYELRRNEELTLLESHRTRTDCVRAWAILAKISEVGDLSDEESLELDALLKRTTERLLVAPADIHEMLREKNRIDIVSAFLTLRSKRLPVVGATVDAAGPVEPLQTPDLSGTNSSPA